MTAREYLEILHVAERLKDTPRHCTTSKRRTESVAEHSWRVSLMAMLLFIGGMIMFMLGLIGEYIGRIYISLNNSPQFVIRQTYNAPGRSRRDKEAGA